MTIGKYFNNLISAEKGNNTSRTHKYISYSTLNPKSPQLQVEEAFHQKRNNFLRK